jgi:hypothetical protein
MIYAQVQGGMIGQNEDSLRIDIAVRRAIVLAAAVDRALGILQ